MQSQTDVARLLEQIPFWGQLTSEEQAQVVKRQYIAHYQPGQVVCGGGGDCLGMVLVVNGVLRTYLLSPEGKEITLYRVRKGESCVMAAACVLRSISFESHVEAEGECEALLIPIDLYSALMRDNVHVKAISYQMATERFSDVVAGLERMAFLNLEQRLASFLLDEAAEGESDTVHMTHEQIATSIGSAREAVSRTLKTMAGQGLVELFRGGVRLKEKPSLYRLIG